MGYPTEVLINAPLRDGVSAEDAWQRIEQHFLNRIATAGSAPQRRQRTKEWEMWKYELGVDRIVFFTNEVQDLNTAGLSALATAIAPLVQDGWHIWCQGEDHHDTWAIAFAGGRWKRHKETQYYGNAYEHFVQRYGKRLPKRLKAALDLWWQRQSKNTHRPEVQA